MGKVKAWLMEMEDRAFALIAHIGPDNARDAFLTEHPGQEAVFERCLSLVLQDEYGEATK